MVLSFIFNHTIANDIDCVIYHADTYFHCFRVQTVDCGEKVSDWLLEFLGKPCSLIRQSPSFVRDMKMGIGKGTILSIAHHVNHYIVTAVGILC